MFYRNRCAKVNVKVLIILIVITVGLGVSLVTARQIRRSILSERDLKAGQAAFEKKDWQEAVKNYREYLGRHPDDVEVLKKYAKACLSIRPLDAAAIAGAISAYRRVVQLDPRDQAAYTELATLYTATGNFAELAYVARTRLATDPNDRKAPLWLAQALVQLNKTQEARQTLQKFIDELKTLPDKQVEYVQACVQMSNIVSRNGSPDAKIKALEWLNGAVEYDPISVEVLAHRAQFYRETSDLPGVSTQDRLALARKDLEAADALGTQDPRIRYFLGAEWMAHGELDRAAAELQAVEGLPQEALEEHFLDIRDWAVARFLFASELAMRRGATAEAASLADDALAALTEKRHRVQVLPSALPAYVAAGKVAEARRCLDEYLDALGTQQGAAESETRLAWLQALVAGAEEKPYVVIDVLQPVVVTDPSRPGLWRLLAEAYSRTDQTRRAVNALIEYLRYYPRDAGTMAELARQYSKLGDWNKAFEAARTAESVNPTDPNLKLLRIEASMSLAVEQRDSAKAAKLEELSVELGQLRQEHPDRVGIRALQAIIAMSLGQPEKAETELKLAIQECKEPLKAQMQLVRHYSQGKKLTDAAGVCRAACERHPEVAEPWLSLAELHVANADYDSARKCLQQGLDAVTAKQAKRSISIRLALLELAQGDRATGIRLLNELAAQDRQEIRARLLLLGTREIQGDRAAAERLVGELRQIEGESGLWWRLHQASLWLSSDGWRSKQPDIASLLQYCIDSDPQWSAPVLLLVGMYERLADFTRVEDTCRQALARNHSAADIADRLLALLERQGRFADAEKVLQQTGANPRFASAWQVRMALGAKDFPRAIDELKVRASNDDQDASSRIQLARLVYQETKDADQALRYLKEAEAIAPRSRTLTAVRASILRAEGQTEEAQQVLDDYVAAGNDFDAYWLRAVYLAEEGELEHAEKDYRKLTTFAQRGAQGYVLLSSFYAGKEKLDQAVAALEEGLTAYPDDLGLKRNVMKLLFMRARGRDRERGLGILAALEKQLPQDPELMTVRALQMLQEPTPPSLSTVRARLENAVKMEPTAVNAHLVLIGIAMQEGEYANARDLAIRALGSNPGNSALLSARGRAELALGNTQMAIELAHLILQKDPNSTDAMDVLAGAALSSEDRGLLDEARTRIERAVGNDPQNEKLLLSRAHILASLEEPQKAISELEAYCQSEKGSRSVVALVTLADLYRLSGDMDRSGQRIAQAERLDAKNLTVVHARFLWLVAQKRYEELAHISSAYLSAKGQDSTMLLRAASMLLSLDSMDLKKEAVKLFEHAATLAPTSVDARLGLASGLYQTGDAEGAEKVYRELLEKRPDDVRVLNDLAWVLQEHGQRYADALELANRGLRLAPGDLHLLDTRGTILSNLPDRLADARKDYEELVRLSSSDARRQAKALLQLGRTCVKLSDLPQAKRHLENAMGIDQKMQVFTPDERSEISKLIVQMKGLTTQAP